MSKILSFFSCPPVNSLNSSFDIMALRTTWLCGNVANSSPVLISHSFLFPKKKKKKKNEKMKKSSESPPLRLELGRTYAVKSAEAVNALVALGFIVADQTAPLCPIKVPIQSPV